MSQAYLIGRFQVASKPVNGNGHAKVKWQTYPAYSGAIYYMYVPILSIQTSALYKSFTYLFTYLQFVRSNDLSNENRFPQSSCVYREPLSLDAERHRIINSNEYLRASCTPDDNLFRDRKQYTRRHFVPVSRVYSPCHCSSWPDRKQLMRLLYSANAGSTNA